MKHLAYASHGALRIAVCAALSFGTGFGTDPRQAMAQVPAPAQEQPAGNANKTSEVQPATEAQQRSEAERAAEAERQREAERADRRYEEERPENSILPVLADTPSATGLTMSRGPGSFQA
jgi:hypothetical protein